MQPAAAKDEGCPDKGWILRLELRGRRGSMVCRICQETFRRDPSGVRNGGRDRLVLRFGERGTANPNSWNMQAVFKIGQGYMREIGRKSPEDVLLKKEEYAQKHNAIRGHMAGLDP
jgi:hypothetical protein